MDLGTKIKEYLLKKHGNIQQAALALNITRQQLYPYFKNKVEPGAGFLKKLQNDGCDINWLLSESESDTKFIITESTTGYNTSKIEDENSVLKEQLRKLKNELSSISRDIKV